MRLNSRVSLFLILPQETLSLRKKFLQVSIIGFCLLSFCTRILFGQGCSYLTSEINSQMIALFDYLGMLTRTNLAWNDESSCSSRPRAVLDNLCVEANDSFNSL